MLTSLHCIFLVQAQLVFHYYFHFKCFNPVVCSLGCAFTKDVQFYFLTAGFEILVPCVF